MWQVSTITRLGIYLVCGKKLLSLCTITIPNGGSESTTVTATISSHDVYTKLYAEETRKQVKLNAVLIQAQKCLQGLTVPTSSLLIVCMSQQHSLSYHASLLCLDSQMFVVTHTQQSVSVMNTNNTGVSSMYVSLNVSQFKLKICLHISVLYLICAVKCWW